MSNNIDDIVVAAIGGDEDAFEELVKAFQKPVFYTVYRVVRNHSVADDITQEIFVKVFQKIKGLKKVSSFKSWLLRAALNKAIDCKRKMTREGEKVFLLDDFSILGQAASSSGVSSGNDSLENKERLGELQDDLHNAVESLPEAQRKVFYLSLEELTHSEIGKILAIPAGTVKSRLHHARKFLAVRLKKFVRGD